MSVVTAVTASQEFVHLYMYVDRNLWAADSYNLRTEFIVNIKLL